MRLDPQLPQGPVADAWSRCRQDLSLIAPANRRHFRVLVVGSGLAGASAAASLAEQGYQVRLITYHDSPRRAHSVAAQGASTLPATIRTTATASSGCSATP